MIKRAKVSCGCARIGTYLFDRHGSGTAGMCELRLILRLLQRGIRDFLRMEKSEQLSHCESRLSQFVWHGFSCSVFIFHEELHVFHAVDPHVPPATSFFIIKMEGILRIDSIPEIIRNTHDVAIGLEKLPYGLRLARKAFKP